MGTKVQWLLCGIIQEGYLHWLCPYYVTESRPVQQHVPKGPFNEVLHLRQLLQQLWLVPHGGDDMWLIVKNLWKYLGSKEICTTARGGFYIPQGWNKTQNHIYLRSQLWELDNGVYNMGGIAGACIFLCHCTALCSGAITSSLMLFCISRLYNE
jgi:hypothetical protein